MPMPQSPAASPRCTPASAPPPRGRAPLPSPPPPPEPPAPRRRCPLPHLRHVLHRPRDPPQVLEIPRLVQPQPPRRLPDHPLRPPRPHILRAAHQLASIRFRLRVGTLAGIAALLEPRL